MNDLQLALLALGIVIIFGVIAFNWWQERKFRNETIRRFGSPKGDALLNDEFELEEAAVVITRVKSVEPAPMESAPVETKTPEPQKVEPEFEKTALADTDNHVDVDSSEPEQAISIAHAEPPVEAEALPQAEDALPTDREDQVLESAERAAVVLSPENDLLVDLVALLALPEAVTGSRLREFLPAVADIDKPMAMHGLDSSGVWHLIGPQEDAMVFTMASCRLQLADRAGFVSQNMLDRFRHEVERLAARLDAELTWQPQDDAWQRANELDQFCIDVDQMVGFHLIQGGNGPFTGTKFRGLAEANGLELGTDGSFQSSNEEGLRLFSVVNRDNNPFNAEMLRTSVIYGITFQLDIPRVKNCLETFNQMVLTARQMEKSLGASLVDDHQRVLDEAQIEKIRQQLKVIQAKMLTRGIVPGSPTALRLFS